MATSRIPIRKAHRQQKGRRPERRTSNVGSLKLTGATDSCEYESDRYRPESETDAVKEPSLNGGRDPEATSSTEEKTSSENEYDSPGSAYSSELEKEKSDRLKSKKKRRKKKKKSSDNSVSKDIQKSIERKEPSLNGNRNFETAFSTGKKTSSESKYDSRNSTRSSQLKEKSSDNIVSEDIQKNMKCKEQEVEEICRSLLERTNTIIAEYKEQKKNKTRYIVSLSEAGCRVVGDNSTVKNALQQLRTVANVISEEDTPYTQAIELATSCAFALTIQANNGKVDPLTLFYFYGAMSGAADSDPTKWHPLVRMAVIAAIVVACLVLVGFLLSLVCGFICVGAEKAVASGFTYVITHGWNFISSYKFIITTAGSAANQFVAARFFGKTKIQKTIDAYGTTCIKLPSEDQYPDCQLSLDLLKQYAEGLEESELKNGLLALFKLLNSKLGFAKARDKEAEAKAELRYLQPIIFTATAFAYNLTHGDSGEESRKLFFHALKGAGCAKPPNQNILKENIGRIILVIFIIVLTVVFSSFYAFLVFSTISSAIDVVSALVALAPKDPMAPTDYQSSNEIHQNEITQSISAIEKALAIPNLGKKQPTESHSSHAEINKHLIKLNCPHTAVAPKAKDVLQVIVQRDKFKLQPVTSIDDKVTHKAPANTTSYPENLMRRRKN